MSSEYVDDRKGRPWASTPATWQDPYTEPMWPVWLAIAALTVSLGVIIGAFVGFEGQSPYENGWMWLGVLGLSMAAFVGLGVSTRRSVTRRMQTAVVLSLLFHVLMAVYLQQQKTIAMAEESPPSRPTVRPVPTIPDYFLPSTDRPRELQAYERPVESHDVESEFTATARRHDAERPEVSRHWRPDPNAAAMVTNIAPQQPRIPRPAAAAPATSPLPRNREFTANAWNRPVEDRPMISGDTPRDVSDDLAGPGRSDRRRTSSAPRQAQRGQPSTRSNSASSSSQSQTLRAETHATDVPATPRASERLAGPSTEVQRRSTPTEDDARPASLSRLDAREIAPPAPDESVAQADSGTNAIAELGSRRSAPTRARMGQPFVGARRSDRALGDASSQQSFSAEIAAMDAGPSRPQPMYTRDARDSTASAGPSLLASSSAADARPAPRPASLSTATIDARASGVPADVAPSSQTPSRASEADGETDQGELLADAPGTSGAGRRRPNVSPTRRRPATEPFRPSAALAEASIEPGLVVRRSTRQAVPLTDTPSRFLNPSAPSRAQMTGSARDIAPAFARRAARRDQSEGGVANSPEVEATIERGLSYLASIQTEEGKWTLQDTGDVPETSAIVNADSAATGLALLAFLGAGYDHIDGDYDEVVGRGIQHLVRNQRNTGDLYARQSGPANEGIWFYSHGIAAIALCEAYGMTGDPDLRQPAQRAVDFIVASQEPRRGGWRYRPGQMSDLSVSGWQLMALRSAQLAGLEVPNLTIVRTQRLLDRAQAAPDQPARYVYNPWGNDTEAGRYGPQPNTVMTAVGLLMRLYTGWSRDHEALRDGAEFLLTRLPESATPPPFAAMQNPMRDTYYWYNATQVMFHMQGRYWQTWRDRLYPLLTREQVKQGPLAGSWNPTDPTTDRWASSAGRLYLTAFNLLSLEVYYRHLPLFESALE